MWTGVDETKTLKKMNQILTILLRNVSSSSNLLSVVVKEVKQGNRFSQQPSPAALAARLLHAASILAKTRNDDKKAFWSHSGHVVPPPWRVYVRRLWGGSEVAASRSWPWWPTRSGASRQPQNKQFAIPPCSSDTQYVCGPSMHAMALLLLLIMVITLDPHIISEWRDKQHVLVPTLCAQITNEFRHPVLLSSNGPTANNFVYFVYISYPNSKFKFFLTFWSPP